ncbi:MAG: preprotein translocase subunit SecY [Parcubacteria group bacterium]|nr:preprotein translocase subunit SecY [Parcubacteria group bacterium]
MDKILKLFKIPDLRKRVFFIVALLIVFRVAAAVPVPGIDTSRLAQFFEQNQLFGLISLFTGGGLENLSIVMLGVGPYITASIIMQLLTMIFPSLEQMYKYEGEAGRAKFNQYSRLLTVPLAILQGFGFLTLLSRQQGLVGSLSLIQWVTALLVVTAGTMFVMWLGELITEKNLGNGVSLIIFGGIISRGPQTIRQLAVGYDPSQLFTYIGYFVLAIIIIAGVIYISEAQRNIPITYAKRVRGFKVYGGVSTYLPMRVNNAGVIPIIFALSLLLFPGMVANFFAGSNIAFISKISQFFTTFLNNQFAYGSMYFLLVVLFTYFYTAVTFSPKSISENIQRQGGYIPGIRPGPATADFLTHLLNRVTLVGALFLGLIAVLPSIVQGATGITAFALGGTSLLIVVSVALEVMKQVQAQLAMYEY